MVRASWQVAGDSRQQTNAKGGRERNGSMVRVFGSSRDQHRVGTGRSYQGEVALEQGDRECGSGRAGSRESPQPPDSPDPFGGRGAGGMVEVPCELQVEPELGLHPEQALEAEGRVGGHPSLRMDELVHPREGDADPLGQLHLRPNGGRNGGRCVPGIPTLPISRSARTGSIGVCIPACDFSARSTSSLNRNADSPIDNRRSSAQGSLR